MTTRPGFALLYAVFMVMALSVVGLSVMATGTRETMIAIAVERQAQARARAEAAALAAIGQWSTRALSILPVDPSRDSVLPSAVPGAQVTVLRLDTTLYLLRAEAVDPLDTTAPEGARARAALIVRTLSPTVLHATVPATITATRRVELGGGQVLEDNSCAEVRSGALGEGAGVLAPEVHMGAGSMVEGEPAVLRASPPPPAAPDPFAGSLAAALADVRPVRSVVTPGPVAEEGRCVAGGRNWGAVEPSHPCHTLLPFIHRVGPLTMTGGEGRGVLVVEGDAHLTAGAQFHGILVVHGRLLLDGGATVRGAVRARSVALREAEVLRDGCALSDAIAAPVLDQAFGAPGRWWVPVF